MNALCAVGIEYICIQTRNDDASGVREWLYIHGMPNENEMERGKLSENFCRMPNSKQPVSNVLRDLRAGFSLPIDANFL